MIMFDYLITKGVKHPKKWLYNMETAPYQGGPWGVIGIFKEICLQEKFVMNIL